MTDNTYQAPTSIPAQPVVPTNQSQLPSWLKKPGALIALGVVVGLFLFWIFAGRGQKVITVSGRSKLQFETDKAEISLLYFQRGQLRGALYSQSQVDYDRIMNQVEKYPLEALAKGPAQTTPQASGNGFEYRRNALVKISGTDSIKSILRQLESENIIIAGMRYLPTDEDQVQKELLDAALVDARVKAKHMARASNKFLGGLVAVSEVASNAETGTGGISSSVGSEVNNVPQVELQKVVQVTYRLSWLPSLF